MRLDGHARLLFRASHFGLCLIYPAPVDGMSFGVGVVAAGLNE
jgi:hypothetical protein